MVPLVRQTKKSSYLSMFIRSFDGRVELGRFDDERKFDFPKINCDWMWFRESHEYIRNSASAVGRPFLSDLRIIVDTFLACGVVNRCWNVRLVIRKMIDCDITKNTATHEWRTFPAGRKLQKVKKIIYIYNDASTLAFVVRALFVSLQSVPRNRCM